MNTLYRSVGELPEAARTFLRWSLYYGGPEFDGLDADMQETVERCEYSDDIPDDILDYAFSGYDFVPEDFVSGAGDDWGKVK